MADIKNLKFDDAEFKGKDIVSLSDTPSEDGISARELKERFDNVGKYMVALGKHNELIDALQSCDQDGSGAQNIGVYKETDGVQEQSNVQQRLDELAYDVANFSVEGGDTLMVKSEYAGDSYGVVRNAMNADSANSAANATKLGGLTLQELKKQIMLEIYPVGAVYMSVSGKSPAELFGGTWTAWGAGRVPVSAATSGTFAGAEKTGGAETVTLETAQMPSHTHTQNQHSHSGISHTHTANHAHTMTHQHSISMGNAGSHTHVNNSGASFLGTGSGQEGAGLTINGSAYQICTSTNSSGNHTHSLSCGNSPTNTGTASLTTSSVAQSAANATAVNQNTGGGNPHNNLQPYITCYMWKRTA